MNRQNFDQSVGFPFQTETLSEMQKAYNLMQAFGDLAGNFSIISGCVTTGTNVTDGVVYINGELIEFKGGTAGANVVIVETIIKQEFQYDTEKDVVYLRHATFGAGIVSFPWADFKRPKNTQQLSAQKAEQTVVEALIERIVLLEARPPANVPIGLVALWVLPFNTIPPGWVEHVPLRGRVAVGLDPDDTDFDALGTAGGQKNKTLDMTEIPAHDHETKPYGGVIGTNSNQNINSPVNGPSFNRTGKVGGLIDGSTKAFSLMNPNRIVHYIKYTG